MKKVLAISVLLSVGFVLGVSWKGLTAHGAGGAGTPNGNGDVNGNGSIDISDAVYTLNWLFTGGPAPVAIECPPAVGGTLPATGETRCFDWGVGVHDCASTTNPGQDGFYQAGCPTEGRFVDNGDGTVTDTCTRLMWQKDTADVNADGNIDSADGLAWVDALAYCESLSFAGHADWRLPNVRELQSIVDYGYRNPAIHPIFGMRGPGGSQIPWPGNFWSSSTYTGDEFSSWIVVFSDGRVINEAGADPGTSPFYVRAVRNAQPIAPPTAGKGLPGTGQTKCYGFDGEVWIEVPCDQAACQGQDGQYPTGCASEGRFTDNGDGTVTDHCTGLMWQKDTADVNGDDQSTTDQDFLPWCEALAFCENLSFAGHDDWRLPNVRELQSIVDYGRLGPSIDPVFGAFSADYWSSTADAGSPGDAWLVFFRGGSVGIDVKDRDAYYVRAVRNAP